MKNKYPIIFKLLIIMPLFLVLNVGKTSGDNEIDSLIQRVSVQSDENEKVETLLLLARHYTYINLDSALIFCKQSIALSKQLEYIEGLVDGLYRESLIYKKGGDLNLALDIINSYLKLVDSLHDETRLAKGYFQYANLIRIKGKRDSALYYNNKSIHFYLKTNDTSGLISNYNSKGNLFLEIAAYDSAVIYYHKTIKLCKAFGRERNLGIVFANIGKVYFRLGQNEDARRYFQKSLEIDKKYNQIGFMGLTYTKIGNVANVERKFDEAISYYKKAEEIYNQLKYDSEINDLYNNYAEVYQKQGKYELAISYYNKALIYYREQNLVEGIIIASMNKGAVYSMQAKYKEALVIFDTCLELSIKTGDKRLQKDALDNISDTYSDAGNYKKAFEYLILADQLHDSIYSIEKDELITNLTLKYEKEKDQAHILSLKNENLEKDFRIHKRTAQRNLYLFVGIGVISFVLFLLVFFHVKARKDKIIADQKIRQLEEEKKVLAARSLVEGQENERKRIAKDLHDGLGVLLSTAKIQFSSIKHESPENKSILEKATKLLEQASGDVRKISHNMMPGLLTKFGVFEAVRDIVDKINDTEELSASFGLSGPETRLPENKEIMLYRIIQEMINNTLKHARAKTININMEVLPNQLNVNYSDDGKGFDMNEKLAQKSIGLQSIQSRLNFLDGKLNFKSEPGSGVEFIMNIPN